MATFRTRTGKDGATSVHTMVRLAGYPTRTATLPNMREAKRWAATVEAEMVEGRHFKGTEGRKRTLAAAITRYRAEVLPLKRNGSMYGFTLYWWDKQHGDKLLGEITRGYLSDCRSHLLVGTFRRSTPGSKATANRYMAALSSVFSHVCGDWEWLQPHANPFTGFGKLPEGRNKGRAYTDDARARLLQETAKDPQLHVLVQVALATAARAGELVGLTWSHVQLGDTEGRLMFVDTKNGDARVAWLFGDALAALKAHSGRQGVTGVTGIALAYLSRPVFPGQWSHKAGRYGRYDYLPRLHKALKAAGLDMKRPFHALRHTAATNLARMGANGHQLKALGGWKSNAVDTYVHMAGQDTKDLAKRLANDTVGK